MKLAKSIVGFTVVGLLVSALPTAEAQEPGPDPNRYIVKFKSGPVPRAVLRGMGADVRVELPWLRASAARIPAAALGAIRNHPAVEYVEPRTASRRARGRRPRRAEGPRS